MAAISQPQIIYNPGSGPVTLPFVRGPQNFMPYYEGRLHDNLGTSQGTVRERLLRTWTFSSASIWGI